MFQGIRGISYYYHIHSQNQALPYLVMLHGFMGDSGIFGHLIRELSGFCNPVTVDLIGHGRTDAPADPERYGSDDQTADLAGLFQYLGLHNFFLLGYSMGGRLALRVAINTQARISGLILESTTCGIEDSLEREKRIQSDRKNAGRILQDLRTFIDHWNRNPLFTAERPLPNELKEKLTSIQERQRPEGLANSLAGFGSAAMPSVRNRLKNITVPTLIITGRKDTKYTRLGREMSQQIPISNHYISDGSGHRVHIDDPEQYLIIIKKFIESNKR